MSASAHDASPRSVWVDPSWLRWKRYPEGTAHDPDEADFRAYEVHNHAAALLEGNPNEFNRVDAIMTLRRTVARRVKKLQDIYQLRKLPTGAKPKRDLELLEYFGIIRPFMLHRLIDIRNAVEHQDSKPPSADECLMFADLVWYFLRSTDRLTQTRVEEIVFVPPEVDFYGSREFYPAISLDFPHFFEDFSESPKVKAWLVPSSLCYEPTADWVKIEADEMTRYEEHEPPRVLAKGKIKGTAEQMKLLYELYFTTSHFG